MKNGVYFIVIAVLVVELFKILIYANSITCHIIVYKVDVLQELHIVIAVMMSP